MDNSYFPDILKNICFKELWDNSPDNMFVVRRDGGVFFIDAVNPAQKNTIVGLDSGIEGMALSSLFDLALCERFASNYNNCLNSQTLVKYEESFLNHEGRYLYYETTLLPVFPENGGEYVYGICRDITELRETELDLSELKQKVEQANKSKISFLANMSHEMRTPLNGISSAVSLFLESSDASEQKELALIINSSVESLSRITNDVLDFARLNYGNLRLELSEFNFFDLLQNVLPLMTPVADARNLTLSYSVSENMPEILYGDTIRIGQILINLIGNAVKFTHHGEVKVSIYLIESGGGQAKVGISVQDTGIGIHEEEISNLFQPFSQVDSSSTRGFTGAGLGLSISRQLAELMGGSITARSSLGQGSIFKVVLPLKTILSESQILEQKKNPVIPVFQEEISSEARGDVLLVEDNHVNSMVAAKILQKSGYEVIFAFNGQEAIDCCKKQAFDVVLMDWHMPVVDGIEATLMIRQLPGCFSLPIIGLTANALKEHMDMCLNAGMNDVLTKPINRDQMISKIRYWMGQAKK